MTEVIALVLKPTKDAKMHNAYVDCLISLTKNFCEQGDSEMVKYVCFTYKELLKKFLGGRGVSLHSLNQQFFTRIFEECNSNLGQSLIRPLLVYILPVKSTDNVESGEEEKTEGSRSNQQRLLAIEIFNSLVKASGQNKDLLKVLDANLEKISAVIITLTKTSDSWKQKKVKKTQQALNIFTKLAKILKQNDTKSVSKIDIQGATIIKAIEEECEKDKSMSNLKGKVKEIQRIIEM